MKNEQDLSPYDRIVDTTALVRLLLLINITGSLVIGAVYWGANGWQETTLSLLLMAAVSSLLLVIHKVGFPQLAGLALYLVVSSVISFNVSIGHGIYDEAMLVYPLLIVFSGLLFGKRSTVLVTAISLTQVSLIYILGRAGVVQPFQGAVEMTLEEVITSLIIILVTGYIVWLVIDIIENAVGRILESEQNLDESYLQTLISWAKALELREREAPGHSARVSSLASLFAEHLGLPPAQVRAVRQGALLHDIGKIGIQESLLLKPEAHLPEERSLMAAHTRLGEEMIRDIDYLDGPREIVAWHHERYDGRGYPDGLEGDQIPLAVQLFSLVDCWDTLRTERPCRAAWRDEDILAYIQDQAGKKFSPELTTQFQELVIKFGLLGGS